MAEPNAEFRQAGQHYAERFAPGYITRVAAIGPDEVEAGGALFASVLAQIETGADILRRAGVDELAICEFRIGAVEELRARLEAATLFLRMPAANA